jgi:hypothetical protein
MSHVATTMTVHGNGRAWPVQQATIGHVAASKVASVCQHGTGRDSIGVRRACDVKKTTKKRSPYCQCQEFKTHPAKEKKKKKKKRTKSVENNKKKRNQITAHNPPTKKAPNPQKNTKPTKNRRKPAEKSLKNRRKIAEFR